MTSITCTNKTPLPRDIPPRTWVDLTGPATLYLFDGERDIKLAAANPADADALQKAIAKMVSKQ